MSEKQNIFINKKILIYGLGKSGVSSYKFLKKKNKISLFDDNSEKYRTKKLNNSIISFKQIKKSTFDLIILSPGINIKKCKLKNFLKKNLNKIYSDFDVFYSFYKNPCITITGTNGKSTTCQLLYEVLKKQKYDVRLAGNIGYPLLSVKNVKKQTIFVIEASSYQLDYSKLFSSKYAVILNIFPDHLERHKNMSKYICAKFKLLNNQTKNSLAFVNKNNNHILNNIKKSHYKSKIIKVDTKLKKNLLKTFNNEYFSSTSNVENLSFVIEIAKKFKIKKKNLIKVVHKFKGLKYRQQTILKKEDILIINDSKSTSYSSSIQLLKRWNNIYWLLGGIPKKGDRFNLPKNYFKYVKGYIFGSNQSKFLRDLNTKIKLKRFTNLKMALIELSKDLKKDYSKKKTILFSPAAASFDKFKNFEDRGFYFNKIVKKYIDV